MISAKQRWAAVRGALLECAEHPERSGLLADAISEYLAGFADADQPTRKRAQVLRATDSSHGAGRNRSAGQA